jgi:preprotein translocase subunit YajC
MRDAIEKQYGKDAAAKFDVIKQGIAGLDVRVALGLTQMLAKGLTSGSIKEGDLFDLASKVSAAKVGTGNFAEKLGDTAMLFREIGGKVYGKEVLSAIIDVMPYLGDAKALAELFAGKNLVTGEDLGWWRFAGLLALAPVVGTGGRAALAGMKNADMLKYLDEAKELFKGVSAGMMNAIRNWGKKACKLNSFSANTKVATASGLVAIAALTTGQNVLAHNQNINSEGSYTVTDTMRHTDPKVTLLALETHDGKLEMLETTPEHPFMTQKGWVDAQKLQAGDTVPQKGGVYGRVKNVQTIERTQEMYNLSVDTAHTFFVGEGQWLVHNADCGEIAFGFTRNLPGFKKVVPQAQNYMDLGLNPYADDFAQKLLQNMSDAKAIHFDISGMRMLTGEKGVLTGPGNLNALGSTNWELRTIWDSPVLREKTIFYLNGKAISAADILKLK